MSTYRTISHGKTGKDSTLSALNTRFIQDNWNKYYGTTQGNKIALLLDDLNRINNNVGILNSVFNSQISLSAGAKLALNNIYLNPSTIDSNFSDLGLSLISTTTPRFFSSNATNLDEIARVVCFDKTGLETLESDARIFLSNGAMDNFFIRVIDQIKFITELETLLDGSLVAKVNDIETSFGAEITPRIKYCLDKTIASINSLSSLNWQRTVIRNTLNSFTFGRAGNKIYKRDVFTLSNYLSLCAQNNTNTGNPNPIISVPIDLTLDLMNYAFTDFSRVLLKYLELTIGNQTIFNVFRDSSENREIFIQVLTDFLKSPLCTNIMKARIRCIGAIMAVKVAIGTDLKSDILPDQAKINQSTFLDWYKVKIDTGFSGAMEPFPEDIVQVVISKVTSSEPSFIWSNNTPVFNNSENTYEYLITSWVSYFTETVPFTLRMASYSLLATSLVVKSLMNDGYVTGVPSFTGPSIAIQPVIDSIYTFFGVDKRSLLSVIDLKNTEMEEYMVQKISGVFLHPSFSRPYLNVEFTISDPNGYNFIPLSSGAFVQTSSGVSITLPFRNSTVKVVNTSSKRISVKIFATGGEEGLYVCPKPVYIEANQDSYVSIV